MLAEMMRSLLAMPEEVWDAYAFRAEPLTGRISPKQQLEYAQNARRCGRELAGELLAVGEGDTPEEWALKLGVKVTSEQQPDSGSYMMFASFTEPDHIRVYQATVDKALELIRTSGLTELQEVNVRQVLVAHELYHYLELTRPELYTAKRLLKLWKLGPFENHSRVSCLGEIGAMAFTQAINRMPFSPYIFDILFLYTQNKRLSRQLFETVEKLSGAKE